MTYPTRDQYINWKSVPQPGKKPKKVPCAPDGREIDPHDPANWMSHDAATATGLLVGFVLTGTDPYFVLDIDDCRDPVTGTYDERAKDAGTRFSGAMIEISHSGTGIHIWGCCEDGLAETYMNKAGGLEFYQAGRFIALGSGAMGDSSIDWTGTLKEILTPRPDASDTEVPETGAVPEYTGNWSDDELIERALKSSSIAVKFGDKASFDHLWNADEQELHKFYPPYGEGAFDRSAADAALCSHLAFWTGKDQARMLRLWRASPLAQSRPDQKKMERGQYVKDTVFNAASTTQAVYSKSSLPGVPDVPVTNGYMTIYEQDKHFEGCVYITDIHKVLTPSGRMLKPDQFQVVYGGSEYQMQPDGGRPTRNAWEAFTQNRCKRFPMADHVDFTPDRPYLDICDGGVNVFKPPQITMTNASPDRFVEFMQKLFPNDRDRTIITSWMAAMVQNPGRKFQWAVVVQGGEGNGKTFMLRSLAHAVGMHMTHLPNPEDMQEKYNTYLEQNLLIGVEEVHMAGRRDILDRLKKYITNDYIEIRGMNTDKRMAANLTNWMFLTNWKDAVLKTKTDRRYAVFFTPQQGPGDLRRDGMDGSYFPDLWDWWRDEGRDAIAVYLRNYQIPDEFNPATRCHRAPDTSSTGESIQQSLGSVEQIILEAIKEDMQGFRGGWVSSIKVKELLKERGLNRLSPNIIHQSIINLGFEWCKTWREGRAGPVMMEGNRRPTLYCTPDINATSSINIGNYLDAQGYIPPNDGQ